MIPCDMPPRQSTEPAHLQRTQRMLTVAATQFACGWDRATNIDRAEHLVRRAAGDGAPGDVASKLPGQDTGEFHLARAGEVTEFSAYRSILSTEQLSERQLLTLATNKRPRG